MRSARSPWLLVATVVVALSALLSMHGLAAHAASGPPASEHEAFAPDDETHRDHAHEHPESDHCPDCGVVHALLSCAVVLVAAAATWAASTRVCIRRTARPALRIGHRAPPLRPRLRPPRPPVWIELAVMRC